MKLPYTLPHFEFEGSVAIVGSSGSLKGKELGEEIDDHDVVVRFNRAPTEGYEKDVGSKTTLRVANNHVFLGVRISESEGYTKQPPGFIKEIQNGQILVISPDCKFPDKSICLDWVERHKGHVDKTTDIHVFNYQNSDGLKRALFQHFEKNMTVGGIATGLFALAAMNDKSVMPPDLYGFDVDPKIDRTHYWEKRPPKASTGIHNISEEMKMLIHLHGEGKVNFKYGLEN